MKVDYVHKDTLTATDYVELNKNNELLVSYNQALLKENQELKKQLEETNKLNNVINELEKWLNNQTMISLKYEIGYYKEVLDKLKELKENKYENNTL